MPEHNTKTADPPHILVANDPELLGTPVGGIKLWFLGMRDLFVHGRLGWYIWQSRKVVGWTRGDEATLLAKTALKAPDSAIIVEIGSFLGCSTILLAGARALRRSGRVHVVDTFRNSGDEFSIPIYEWISANHDMSIHDRFTQNLTRAGLRTLVEIHVGDSSQVASRWNQPIDLLVFDGDQSVDGVQAAFLDWSPWLRRNGLLALHNAEPSYRAAGHDGHARLSERLLASEDFALLDHAATLFVFRNLANTTFGR